MRHQWMAFGYHPNAPFHNATTVSYVGRSEPPEPLESPAAIEKSQKIQSLRDAISHKQPAAFGTLSIPADQWTIFYGKKGNTEYAPCGPLFFVSHWLINDNITRRINLSNASEAELRHLSDACQPATFGVDREDVLDESYRKARKMDITDFATNFNVINSGILDVVRSELLEGHESNKAITTELYKLNVYGEARSDDVDPWFLTDILGKESFFKPHKDTPRSATMFGSLVIVFPTEHEGGALMLRHGGSEWMLDSAAKVRTQVYPSIAYIAFYSDVEHEVTPVTSGYRVTLTYNLYFANEPANNTVPVIPTPSSTEVAFTTALSTLLSDKAFMEKGGYLGFGLQHEYPLDPKAGLGNLINCLKGSDAIIQRVCSQLSLPTELRVIYEDHDIQGKSPPFVMAKDIVDYSQEEGSGMTFGETLIDIDGGQRVVVTGPIADEAAQRTWKVYKSDDNVDDESEDDDDEFKGDYVVDVDWVTDLTNFTGTTSYMAFGNMPQMDCVGLTPFDV